MSAENGNGPTAETPADLSGQPRVKLSRLKDGSRSWTIDAPLCDGLDAALEAAVDAAIAADARLLAHFDGTQRTGTR